MGSQPKAFGQMSPLASSSPEPSNANPPAANRPDPLNPHPLTGKVLYTTTKIDPNTGEEIVVNKPVITLRRSSLERIPQDGENWHVKAPRDPSLTADLQDYVFTPNSASQGGRSIGFIRLYPSKAVQRG